MSVAIDTDTDSSWAYRLKRILRKYFRPARPQSDAWEAAGGSVVVIAPHPDDEVIGCGGTIRRHVLAGDAVTVLYLTRGGNSRGYPWLGAEEKKKIREAEARASCAILGIQSAIFFDGDDGYLAEEPEIARLTAQLAAALDEIQPRMIYIPHAGDHHADHHAAYKMLSGALACMSAGSTCQVWQYEVWSPLIAEVALDITPYIGLKIKALRRHRLALDAFDYISTMKALSAYRCGTLLQRHGHAEAFRRSE